MNNQVVNSNDVVGASVENAQGESLGKIEALMLDKLDGQVAYVVLSFGGFLGMGDKLFAMPWSEFSYDADRDSFVINKSKEELESSPGFDKDNWPNMSDATWRNSVQKHYRQI